MSGRHSVETAYCFFHQKLRVYAHSTLDWQRDDIEQAIGNYAATMDPALLAQLAQGRPDFLRTHATFGDDLTHAVSLLEHMMEEE